MTNWGALLLRLLGGREGPARGWGMPRAREEVSTARLMLASQECQRRESGRLHGETKGAQEGCAERIRLVGLQPSLCTSAFSDPEGCTGFRGRIFAGYLQ